jgi:hypothetical protein
LGSDDDAILLMLRLIAKKAKSMVTLSFNEVEEAIDGDDFRLFVTRQGEALHSVPLTALCVCFQTPMNVNKSS